MKFTKIVATIGPATESVEMIEKFIRDGVDVFRFNFKHNTVEWHFNLIKQVRAIATKLEKTVGILVELQGTSIRITMPVDQLTIKKGDFLLFGEEAMTGKDPGFSITYPEIITHLEEGQKLLADDGTITFYLRNKDGKTYLQAEADAVLKNRKSLNIPGADFPFAILTQRDYEGLDLAKMAEAEYVAISFVRSAADIKQVRAEIKKREFDAKIIAKIEAQKALDHIDEIVAETDGIMIGRGDLGVELPAEEVPFYQKILIKKCLEKGIPVITATQMLQTMITNPYPTRAEVSDVANATYDLSDAVMLSAESAAGEYPLETVAIMTKIVTFNEQKFMLDNRKKYHYRIENQEAILCDAAYNLYLQYRKELAGFVVFSQSGLTARYLSRYHPHVPQFAFVPNRYVAGLLSLQYGVYPFMQEILADTEFNNDNVLQALVFLKNKNLFKAGDKVIVIHGDRWAVQGGNSTIKMVTV